MKNFPLTLCLIFCVFSLQAQLTSGSIAPDFTGMDINGNEHNLYDLLEEGKTVILDFSATWCGPCWSYHNSGALHDFMETHGPEGSDEAMVFYIECDATTGMDQLNGTGSNTTGDWITGTNYPIINDTYVSNQYQIGSYPTIAMICPDRIIDFVGTLDAQALASRMGSCPSADHAPDILFSANEYFSCGGALEVEFYDNTWPRGGEYLWDFGDGNTSTQVNPVHNYSSPGHYSVSLKVENEFGTNTKLIEQFIQVGEGQNSEVFVGGPNNNDFGAGRIFEGGHQGLIFDANKDIVISSVYVYSDRQADRTVVVLDNVGNLINIKTVNIPEGNTRVNLDLFVPAGTDYTLGLYSDAFLFRNSSGPSYPYDISGLATITKSTASSVALDYYYYYYDWNVREATCSEISNTEDLLSELKIYPNPAQDFLFIKSDIDFTSVNIYNAVGKLMNCQYTKNSDEITIAIDHLQSGMYLISIDDAVRKFYKN